jgi:hypothetical protein
MKVLNGAQFVWALQNDGRAVVAEEMIEWFRQVMDKDEQDADDVFDGGEERQADRNLSGSR